jgi:glycosyltransferase involved in cell wall biosynthesis
MSLRILWVKAGKLLPVDTGGKIRSFNLLKHLAARNQTTLLSYYDGPRDSDYEKRIVAELPGAVAINTGKGDSTTAQAVNYLQHLLSTAPYAVTKFTSPVVQDLLSEWDSEGRFDVAVCDFLSASLNFPRAPQTPAVLFQHNVESALWQRQAKHEASLVKRLVFKLEAIKMTRYERSTVRKFQRVIAVSDHDRDQMSEMTDRERISVVPTGVDLKEYSAVAAETGFRADNQNVLFLGSMDWEANVDGVDYFCRGIWPRVQAVFPNAKFYVVGRNPHPRVARWASDSVEITGRVDSVLPYLAQAAVFVVPLRIGGGTRLKIYEAMAAGKAVVSTTVGAEGLDFHHGHDILLADNEEAFATAVIDLLRDVELRRRLGEAAGRLAAQYDWAIIAKGFEEILFDVAKSMNARIKAGRELAQVEI